MNIKTVKVENFRLLKNFKLDYREDISLIVGKNNSGKTSVLTIMDKLLRSGDKRFEWNDFNIIYQKEFYEKLLHYSETNNIFGCEGIRMQIFVEYDKSDNYANLQKFMMDLDPDNNIIVIEFLYSCKKDMIKKMKEDIETLEIQSFIDFTNYMNKSSYKYFELQRYSRQFDSNKGETTAEVSGEIEFFEIKKLINFRSIKANREASNKVNDHSLSSLSQKYHNIHSSVESLTMTELQKAIQNADRELNEAYNGKEGDSGIFSEVFNTIRKFGSDTDITVRSSISEADLLKNNTTLYYKNEDHHLPESYNGLGYLNLIGMIFEIETIISEFHGKENEKPSDINILFIEEPEAHTHPQLQYVFIKNIKNLMKERTIKNGNSISLQTIITTHSSHIVSECEFEDVRYLIKKENSLIAKNFQELETKYSSDMLAFKFVKQYLNLNKSELFFADKAVFIEGDTERILLPAMMFKFDMEHKEDEHYIPLLSQNISIIEAGAYAHKFMPLIEFLGIKVLIITDIDGVKIRKGKACPSAEAKFTSNNSLLNFFDLPNDNTQFNTLTEKGFEDKLISDNIRIAYQTEIIDANGNKYQPRSFEDAFISSDFDYINLNKENFYQGLKNRKKFTISPDDYYNLAQKCIAKKSAFAIEILYYDGVTDGKHWNTPEYIKEGLKWLQEY